MTAGIHLQQFTVKNKVMARPFG